MYYKYYDENNVLIFGESDRVPDAAIQISEKEYNSSIEELKAKVEAEEAV